MNYTLHLTSTCNLDCKYCYENKHEGEISFDNIKAIIDYEINQKSKYSVLTFYGGEPLLKKDLIYQTIEYIKSQKTKTKFYYGMTTNGILLDDDFIEYMKDNDFVNLAYSIDGKKETQDLNRITRDGKGTFDIVEKNAKKLLDTFPDLIAMAVVTKNNLANLSENVEYLIELGFKSINLQFNYTDNWQDEDLSEIKKQYEKVGEIYYNRILNEEDISIIAIEEKIKTHVKQGFNCNEECQLGIKSVNVDIDGRLYPCVQFVENEKFVIGDCKDGIDIEKRKALIESSHKEKEICKNCAINKRCKHTCACRNYMTTKDVNEVSPLVCEFERMLIKIADSVASRLYEKNSKLFLQKFYNEKYSLLKSVIRNMKK